MRGSTIFNMEFKKILGFILYVIKYCFLGSVEKHLLAWRALRYIFACTLVTTVSWQTSVA